MVQYASKPTALLIILFVVLTMTQIPKASPDRKKTEVHGHTMYTVLNPGDIPAIFKPQFISIDSANSLFYDDEPLLVVRKGNETKAYSTWHLDRHEIVNDFIDGTAIAATW